MHYYVAAFETIKWTLQWNTTQNKKACDKVSEKPRNEVKIRYINSSKKPSFFLKEFA